MSVLIEIAGALGLIIGFAGRSMYIAIKRRLAWRAIRRDVIERRTRR